MESANRVAKQGSAARLPVNSSKGGGGAKFQLGSERGHRVLHGGPVLLSLLVSGSAWGEVFGVMGYPGTHIANGGGRWERDLSSRRGDGKRITPPDSRTTSGPSCQFGSSRGGIRVQVRPG